MSAEARLHPSLRDEPLFAAHLFPVDFGSRTAKVERLARRLAASAVERDRAGGSAQAERELIRESGLLTLAVPQQYGGLGVAWPEIYRIVRYLAAVDSSLAHLFAFQHLQVATLLLFGNPDQQRHWLTRTVQERWFWGNATNGRDTGLKLSPREEHFELNGSKSFCSGALGADALVVSAPRGKNPEDRVFIVLPSQREGLAVNSDWDGFGQRQTDSGTVQFEQVFVDASELLGPVGPSPRTTLRACLSQLILTQLYLGNAQGALDAALRYTREQSRAWPASGVATASDDPFIQQRYGELWLRYRSALPLAEYAAQRLQAAWEKPALTAAERAEVALAISEAKVVAVRAALEITSQIFEAMGARATSSRYGFDRFWRNVRVHSLHDPIDYKVRDLGRWLLSGQGPQASLYS
ncbi:acyl-CoA dehydrogenase family protein [Ectopseudomonas alcaliphila]|uniref:acyl-CoA dehydrogenase family protein n=1 Tax=Ectopseudomonas alcaliphila TaxID=101564 RepID=UPI00277D6974|nr:MULTISPECIES: acyl-CoA dehydrogenase family protein [Pseudomonas]MDP9940475.1 alkylation response protein AidB-like acyl-CoA dehydrogenase [Pseudomonas sp. 3400]MDR7011959.1 alkylation response protein AidB-like acyl-CoA dehydrogenase [Pseudomonas alcaliphila]